jgi:hypothetical protein
MRILPLGKDLTDPSGVAIFYEVDDDTLEIIKERPHYYLNADFVQRCFSEKGRNAHLYLLINNGDVSGVINKCRKLMNEFKTVSWWSVGHKKFYLRGNK